MCYNRTSAEQNGSAEKASYFRGSVDFGSAAELVRLRENRGAAAGEAGSAGGGNARYADGDAPAAQRFEAGELPRAKRAEGRGVRPEGRHESSAAGADQQ